MTKILRIIHESIGLLFGMIVYYIFIFIIIIIEGIFFFEEEIIINHTIVSKSIFNGFAFTWLKSGFAGIFIIGGHYLLFSIFMDEIERIRDIKLMKYLFLIYIIWIVVGAILDLSDLYIPDIYVYGGIFIHVIVIIYIYTKNSIAHNKSNQVDQSD